MTHTSIRRRTARFLGALAVGAAVAAACHGRPDPRERNVTAPRTAPPAAVEADAVDVPGPPAPPEGLRPPKTVRTIVPPGAADVVALIGPAAQAARDAVGGLRTSDDTDVAASADGPSAVLLVGTEDELRAVPASNLRRAVAGGALVFVDGWKGDEAWLASLVPGGRLREVTAADDLLSSPEPLGALPPAHSDPDPRIVGVEGVCVKAGGTLRVVATRQDTLCHGCSCDKLAGRRAFGRNLAAHAARVAAASRKPTADPEVTIAAALTGTALHIEASFRNDGPVAATARIDVLPLEGAAVATTSAPLAPGATRTVVLDAALTPPLEVLDHRVVASIEDVSEVVRRVAPLADMVGATDLRVLGTSRVGPGMPAAVRVLLRNSKTGDGVPGADMTLRLVDAASGRDLATAHGTTDAAGTTDASLRVPEDVEGACRLVVAARTALGTDDVAHDVRPWTETTAHVFLDLPVHRPGDRVRARALVVRQPTGKPVPPGASMTWTLLGPDDRPVTTAPARVGRFGVAEGALDVPEGATTGDWHLELRGGDGDVARVPIRIERFEVPRFRVTVEPAVRSVRPGGVVTARVRAERFDGGALAAADVTATLHERAWGARSLARWDGLTDADGAAEVRIDVPADAGARWSDACVLDVTVRDAGGRTVRDGATFAWSHADRGPVLRVASPDGPLVAGMPSRVLLRTDLPEGAEVAVAAGDGAPRTETVDRYGFVEVPLADPRPGTRIRLGDVDVAPTVETRPLALVVPHRIVAAGAKVRVLVRGPRTSSVVLVDLLRDRALVATWALPLADGRAEADLAVPEGVAGPVTLQAYLPTAGLPDAVAQRAFVLPAEHLRVSLVPSAADARPGAPVSIDLLVTDTEGQGVPSALGVRVADEAVLSLVDRLPGSARVALVTGRAMTGRLDADTARTAADVVGLAGRRALTEAETRLADLLLADGTTVRHDRDASSLPVRRDASRARAVAVWEHYARLFRERALEAVGGPLAPPPSADVPHVAAAIAAAAGAGAFGPAWHLDPWGTPIRVGSPGLLPLDDTDETAGHAAFAAIDLASDGPDCVRGTEDDLRDSLSVEDTLALHERWVTAHGHTFSAERFLAAHGTIGIGGGAGGAFGGRSGGGGRKSQTATDSGDGAPPRMRRVFPQVALFVPLVLTDAEGRARVSLVAPDSLTTWRAEAVASDAAGHAADGETPFRTTLPFAAEIDPPETLLVGDEVEIPVLLRWTGAARTDAVLDATVTREGRITSPTNVTVAAPANGEGSATFRVRAERQGVLHLVVQCTCGGASDASERAITVLPAGRAVETAASGRATTSGATLRVRRSADTLADSERLELRLRAGPVADVLAGVDGLLRRPHGCFEQASSTLFPDVLALRYLKGSDALTPALRDRFDEAIDDGIDLLLSYEIPGGGFDWFGRPAAKPLLTAYGLHEWWTLAAVGDVGLRTARRIDQNPEWIARRTAKWLVAQQAEDGTFPAEGVPYEWKGRAWEPVTATAYVGWALARAPESVTEFRPAVDRARAFVVAHAADLDDPYAVAVAAVFLLERDAADAEGARLARRLASLGERKGDVLRMPAGAASAFHGKGACASVETTALAALAAQRLAKDDVLPAAPLVAALAADRRADGTWGTTQATVLALWAMLEARESRVPAGTVVVVRPKGGAERRVTLDAADLGRTVVVDLADLLRTKGDVEVSVSRASGGDGGSVAATLAARCAVAFDAPPSGPKPALALTVTPGTTSPAAGGALDLAVRLVNRGDAPVAMPIVEVPLPSGVLPDLAAIARVRARPDVARVEADAARIVVYLREIAPRATFACVLGTSPRLRGRVTLPQAEAYAYYEPDRRALARSAVLTVR